MQELKNFLINEVIEQTKKGKKFVKKYNLSLYDVIILKNIVFNQWRTSCNFNILPVLDKYKIKYNKDDINFYIEDSNYF